MERRRSIFLLACGAGLLLASTPVLAERSFLDSDDYRQGKAVVGVLLGDDDYAKMQEDVLRGDAKLDWAWVVGQGDSPKLQSPGFSVDDYASIVVRYPEDHTDGDDWIAERAHEVLQIACTRVGWVSVAADADLVLATAIVDASDAEGFGPVKFFNATNRHLLEFEFRLTEAASGRTLLVAREQVTSANMVGTVWRGAWRLQRFLDERRPPRYPKHGGTVSLDLLEMPGKKAPHKFEKHSDPRAIVFDAMRDSGIFEHVAADPVGTDHGLEVRFREANLVGAYQTTVNLVAVYTLTDRSSGEILAEEEIGTSTTLSALEIRSGGKRLKATVSAAFVDSIDSFLFRLARALASRPSP